MNIEAKIAKLDALIASTTHAGEKEAALLAKERLLKKLHKRGKYQRAYEKKKNSDKKKQRRRETSEESQQKSEQDSKRKQSKKKEEKIDDFFYQDENCIREESDTSNATFRQKQFISNLVYRSKIAIPSKNLKFFLSQIGFEQASRIINNLFKITGDPRNKPASEKQMYFLSTNSKFEISEETIGILTSLEANTIITAIKLIKKLEQGTKNE